MPQTAPQQLSSSAAILPPPDYQCNRSVIKAATFARGTHGYAAQIRSVRKEKPTIRRLLQSPGSANTVLFVACADLPSV